MSARAGSGGGAVTVRRAAGGRVVFAAGPLGGAVSSRHALATLAVLAAGTAAFLGEVALGTLHLPLPDVVAALAGGGDPQTQLIVTELRLPRALTATLVGLAFGLAGAIMQAIARNPLASPDLLGMTQGASAGAVGAIVLTASWHGAISIGALAGGLAAGLAVYALAHRRRELSGYRLVLVGLAFAFTFRALTAWLIARADITQAGRAMVWLTGSLNGRGWEHVAGVGIALAVAVPVALALVRPFGVLQLGDDTGRTLGLPIARARGMLLLAAVVLAAVATASAGPIEFVALAAPQVARRLAGTAGVPLVLSGLTGASAVLAADLVARLAFAPTELPVGIVTGVVGAPYLLWLLARGNRAGRGG